MGLDVYVGPLSRYYARDWKTIRGGVEVAARHAPACSLVISDPFEALPVIQGWVTGLAESLREHGVDLYWCDEPDGRYFTDEPSWQRYGDLLVRAAYLDHPELVPPDVVTGEHSADPAYVASQKPGFATRFPQLLHGAEMWLPADFDFTFSAADPAGNTMMFGSSHALLRELGAINDACWRGSAEDLGRWRREGIDAGAPLDRGARFCCSMLSELCAASVAHRVPMKLDY
jgi:hypothetical protein